MTSRLKFGARGRYFRVWFCSLALFGATGSAFSQLQIPVTTVSITNIGPQTVSDALIRSNIKVKEGDTYSQVAVNEDISHLYSTGFFLDVRVLEKRTPEGVSLLYALQ